MADQRWLTPAEMAAWLAFLDVSHRLDRVIEQQLRRDAGLSHAQYEILSRLESAPGGQLRMSDLAALTDALSTAQDPLRTPGNHQFARLGAALAELRADGGGEGGGDLGDQQ